MSRHSRLRLARPKRERQTEPSSTSLAEPEISIDSIQPVTGGLSNRVDYDLGHIPVNPAGESVAESSIQRQAEALTRPIGPEGGTLDDATGARIEAARDRGGAPLDSGARAEMEPLFRYDFSQVRIFADSEADGLNRDLGASAFTTGSDIFFREGSYDPASQQGQALLAHELTHVVQQDGASGTPQRVGPADDAREQEAGRVAAGAMSAPVSPQPVQLPGDPGSITAPASTLRRQPLPATEDKKTTPGQSTDQSQPQPMPGQIPGLGPAGERQHEFPAWSNYVPSGVAAPGQIPGDLPPGYEQPRLGYSEDDVRDLMLATDERDSENKQNAGQFVADYGATLLSIWSDFVMDAVEKAGKKAEWSTFGDILGFVVRKGLEVLSTEFFMAAVAESAFMEFMEILTTKAEKVVETGVESVSGFGLEGQEESIKDKGHESAVEEEEEKLRHLTRTLSSNFSHLAFETIKDLPSPGPYYYWLSAIRENHDYSSLAMYRIPHLFPQVPQSAIETAVAGSIAAELWRVARPELTLGNVDDAFLNSAEFVRAGDDNSISVDGPGLNKATARLSSPSLKEALIGKKIHDLPMIPLFIDISGVMDMETAATKLMAAYRAIGPANPAESSQFVSAYGKESVEAVNLMRNADGEFFASSLAGHVLGALSADGVKTDFPFPAKLFLYQWATSDWDLTQLADYILNQAPVSIEAHEQGLSELVPADTLAQLTRGYFESPTMGDLLDKGAANMLKNHIEELVLTGG